MRMKRRGPGRSRDKRSDRKKRCRLCGKKVSAIDYKDVDLISSFMTDRAKIIPRRTTGNCAKHQRVLTVAIRRARKIALLPYTTSTLR